MKNKFLSVFAFVLLVVGVNNINAETMKATTAIEKTNASEKSKLSKSSSNPSLNSVIQAYSLYGTTGSITSNTSTHKKVTVTQSGSIKAIMTYKKVGANYIHISTEYSEPGHTLTIKLNENTSSSSCTDSSLTKGYCLNRKITSIDERIYSESANKTVKTKYIIAYGANAYWLDDYNYTIQYSLVSGKLVPALRIDAPRSSASTKILYIKKTYYHTNSKVKSYIKYKSLNYTTTPARFTYQAYDKAAYNTRGQLTSSSNVGIYNIYKNRKWYNKVHVKLSATSKTYYSNGKLKTNLVSKKSKYNNFTSMKKTTYRSNGKKSTYKVRSYRSGKSKKHYFYKYNSLGNTKARGAYRVTVNFNKKGKATSAYKAKYKKNGKLNKAYKVKLKKSLYAM